MGYNRIPPFRLLYAYLPFPWSFMIILPFRAPLSSLLITVIQTGEKGNQVKPDQKHWEAKKPRKEKVKEGEPGQSYFYVMCFQKHTIVPPLHT